mmetsp:Transcript_14007/g.21860  ORF Transcript_14007/g.21860 Transcript_14007/m.21860 type:complete len:84 (-) Transcript_14007:113-364(-)
MGCLIVSAEDGDGVYWDIYTAKNGDQIKISRGSDKLHGSTKLFNIETRKSGSKRWGSSKQYTANGVRDWFARRNTPHPQQFNP